MSLSAIRSTSSIMIVDNGLSQTLVFWLRYADGVWINGFVCGWIVVSPYERASDIILPIGDNQSGQLKLKLWRRERKVYNSFSGTLVSQSTIESIRWSVVFLLVDATLLISPRPRRFIESMFFSSVVLRPIKSICVSCNTVADTSKPADISAPGIRVFCHCKLSLILKVDRWLYRYQARASIDAFCCHSDSTISSAPAPSANRNTRE